MCLVTGWVWNNNSAMVWNGTTNVATKSLAIVLLLYSAYACKHDSLFGYHNVATYHHSTSKAGMKNSQASLLYIK